MFRSQKAFSIITSFEIILKDTLSLPLLVKIGLSSCIKDAPHGDSSLHSQKVPPSPMKTKALVTFASGQGFKLHDVENWNLTT